MLQTEKLSTMILSAFIVGYPPSVMAASLLDTGPMGVTWAKYGYVILMATWGAAAALLQRFASGETIKWKIIIPRDFVNATLAAVLTFWVCEHFNVPPAIESVSFTLAAYGGARFMEFIYGRFIHTTKGLTDQYAKTLKKQAKIKNGGKNES